MPITKGPAGPITTSLMDLAEEFRNTNEWGSMIQGGMLSIPVVRFRLMENNRPDKNNTFDYQAHYDEKVGKGKRDIDTGRTRQTGE